MLSVKRRQLARAELGRAKDCLPAVTPAALPVRQTGVKPDTTREAVLGFLTDLVSLKYLNPKLQLDS